MFTEEVGGRQRHHGRGRGRGLRVRHEKRVESPQRLNCAVKKSLSGASVFPPSHHHLLQLPLLSAPISSTFTQNP